MDSRENDSPDEEKPLKKARYMWEIKGKGHLKDSNQDNSPSGSNEEAPSTTNQTASESEDCCRRFLISKSERYINEHLSDDDEDSSPLQNDIESQIPVTLVFASQPQKDQDYYLKKWHARQMARGFVENTINSMLEQWIGPFDASTLVEDTQNDGQVEDDAILMAIQSHGLQSGPNLRANAHSSTMLPLFSSSSNSSAASSTRSESQNNNQEPVVDNLENLQKEQENELMVGSSSSSMIVDTRNQSGSDPYEVDFMNAAVSVAIQKKGLTYG